MKSKKTFCFLTIFLFLFTSRGWTQTTQEKVDTIIERVNDIEQAAEALKEIGEPAVKPLIEKLKNGDWKVRIKAVIALGKIRDPQAVEPLIERLKD